MARTRAFLILLFVFSGIILSSLSVTGWLSNPIVVGVVLIGVALASIVIAQYRTKRSDGKNDGTWKFVPDWQYEGRFAEAGGLTRSEQGDAIENVHERAEELEKTHGRK